MVVWLEVVMYAAKTGSFSLGYPMWQCTYRRAAGLPTSRAFRIPALTICRQVINYGRGITK